MSVDRRGEQVPGQGGRRTGVPGGPGSPGMTEGTVPAQRERFDEGAAPSRRGVPAADADLLGRMRSGDDTAYEE